MNRLLIVAPNWVGDAVLATPTLRAIRQGHPAARIAVLARPAIAEVLAGAPWFDELIAWPMTPNGKPAGLVAMLRQLKGRGFDTAVLMPNSFRTGLLAFLARIPRRVGYARDGRAILLTDPLKPIKQGRKFVAESMLTYYGRLAEAVDAPVRDQRLELFTSTSDERTADELLGRGPSEPGRPGPGGVREPGRPGPGGVRPLIVLNPGGAFGPSKYWPAERFGQLADWLLDRFGGRVVVSGAPAEREIVDRVAGVMKRPAIKLTDSPIPLAAVKALVRRADLLVTNDTGPRHFAIAFGVPVVTLFGSTDPAWTETHCPHERQVRLELACSPCQQKVCPLGHHDCMRKMTVEQVEAPAVELLTERTIKNEK